MSVKLLLFSYPSILTCVLGAQKNRLIETVLLSTHNICFELERKKVVFQYALLSGALIRKLQSNFMKPHGGIKSLFVSNNSLPSNQYKSKTIEQNMLLRPQIRIPEPKGGHAYYGTKCTNYSNMNDFTWISA